MTNWYQELLRFHRSKGGEAKQRNPAFLSQDREEKGRKLARISRQMLNMPL